MVEIEIITPKIDMCEDSIFYDGEIAVAEKPNGTKLSLIACGEIKITIGEDCFKNRQVDEAIDRYKLTDQKLKELEQQGKLEWLNNNWFEVTHLKKGAEFWDSDMCVVAHSYGEAIQLLKNYCEDDNY